jgi:hypothetical protein
VPVFEPNQPIITQEPSVVVENQFRQGRYVFRLVVRRDNVESQPVETVVSVGEEESLRPAVTSPPEPPPDQPAPRRGGSRKRQSSGRRRRTT